MARTAALSWARDGNKFTNVLTWSSGTLRIATVMCQCIPRLANQSLWLSRNLRGRNFVAQYSTSSTEWASSLSNTWSGGGLSMKRCFVSSGLHRTTSLLFLRNWSWSSVGPVEFLEQPDRPCHNGRAPIVVLVVSAGRPIIGILGITQSKTMVYNISVFANVKLEVEINEPK